MRVRALCAALLLLPGSVFADASLYLSPDQIAPEVGKPFVVHIYADSAGHDVNAAEAALTYDPALLRVASVSKEGSLASAWPSEPDVSGDTLAFSAWLGARYSGAQGLLLSVTFVPLRVGQGHIGFTSGTLLAADVQETNVIASMRGASFATVAARIESPIPAPAQTMATTSVEASSTEEAAQASVIPSVPATTSDPGQTAAAAAGADTIDYSVITIVLAVIAGFSIVWLGYRPRRTH